VEHVASLLHELAHGGVALAILVGVVVGSGGGVAAVGVVAGGAADAGAGGCAANAATSGGGTSGVVASGAGAEAGRLIICQYNER